MGIIKGTDIEFCPFVGKISGIPSVLHGSIDAIVAEALKTQEMGVAGIDLLAYRHKENPEELMERVIDALEIPVIVAGSIGSLEQIRRVVKAGAAGFTVGTAVFDRTIVPSGSLEDQVIAVVHIHMFPVVRGVCLGHEETTSERYEMVRQRGRRP